MADHCWVVFSLTTRNFLLQCLDFREGQKGWANHCLQNGCLLTIKLGLQSCPDTSQYSRRINTMKKTFDFNIDLNQSKQHKHKHIILEKLSIEYLFEKKLVY